MEKQYRHFTMEDRCTIAGGGIKGIFTAKTLSSQRKNSNIQWVCFKAHALRCMGLLFTMRVI